MTTEQHTALSIVIPVYNSDETIKPLVRQLIAELASHYALEIILVNDGSHDRSEEVCADLVEAHPEIVRMFSLAKNVGEHNAVMAGLNQVTGDYVVIMDDDFQNPVNEVVTLVETAQHTNCDVIYTYYEHKCHSLFRNCGSWFNDKVANIMLRKPHDLYLSSFKLLTRFLVREIVKYKHPFPYIDGLILRTTDRIATVKVAHQPRAAGPSGYTLRKLLRLWLNMFTNFSILPLRVATMLGFAVSLVGLAMAVYTVLERFGSATLPTGWAMLIIVICLFSGVQLVAIGMIGEYLGRMFLSFNRQPQFTIRRAVDYKGNRSGSS